MEERTGARVRSNCHMLELLLLQITWEPSGDPFKPTYSPEFLSVHVSPLSLGHLLWGLWMHKENGGGCGKERIKGARGRLLRESMREGRAVSSQTPLSTSSRDGCGYFLANISWSPL